MFSEPFPRAATFNGSTLSRAFPSDIQVSQCKPGECFAVIKVSGYDIRPINEEAGVGILFQYFVCTCYYVFSKATALPERSVSLRNIEFERKHYLLTLKLNGLKKNVCSLSSIKTLVKCFGYLWLTQSVPLACQVRKFPPVPLRS